MKVKFSFGGKIALLTAFEAKVLKATMRIPIGEARTYAQIAKEIGNPRASRAVANALGKNPFAPHIPCHRVIRSDGTPGGYSAMGGSAAKRRILLKEGFCFRKNKSV